jgi:hypothetical protein
MRPAFEQLVLNGKLRRPVAGKSLYLATSGRIHAITVSPSSKHHNDPAPSKPIKNLASAPQNGRQPGFCLGGSSAGITPEPPVLQAANRSTAPAGPDGAGRGDHSMDHDVADQCGGCCSGYLATKSPYYYPVNATACNAVRRRVPVFPTD